MPHHRLTLSAGALAGALFFPSLYSPPTQTESAVFAGGCFWGIEAVFEHTKGVVSAVSGYTGGTTEDPTYGDVTTETTGHAESVAVTYDPTEVTYEQLLEVFFAVHDPTQLNRQGPDRGTSYRSAIFPSSPQQRSAAYKYIATLNASGKYQKKIVTTVETLGRFYAAEGYHQNYLAHHPNEPYIVYNDLPKLEHLKKTFPALWRETTTETRVTDQTKHKGTDPKHLTPLQYEVTQNAGTERPFQNEYWNNHAPGIYVDVVSGEPLFSSFDKYDSGTGWPSFTQPLVPENIKTISDRTLGMVRVEVRSAGANSHLGHLFDDGPEPTGQRYCMNSASMRFIPVGKLAEEGYAEFAKLFAKR